MSKKSFVQGAVILGGAGIVIKAMGAVFRIPLANLIGADGMAFYQAAYPIYVLFLTIATAGIPIAISRMVSERIAMGSPYEAYRVFRISFILLLSIGIISASLCFFGADKIVGLMGISEARYAMKSIAPALLFCPMMAAFRGYFQGMQNMAPTAASQVLEQFFRVLTGLTLAFLLINMGKEYAAAGASFGATAGGIAGLITILVIYLRRKESLQAEIDRTRAPGGEAVSKILSKILLIAIPITIGAAIMPIMNFIDAGLVMHRLTAAGWDYASAKSLYGQLSGFVGSLINFPQVLTQAVAMSLVPAVAAAYKQNDMDFLQKNVKLGLRFAVIIGFPCAFGLMTLAEPIMLLIYPMQKESAVSAASCLFVMAFGVIFLSTVQTLTGVLQGVGKQLIPVRNLIVGAIAKVGITYWLTGIYIINVKGAALGTVAAYVIAAGLNLLAVKKYTGTRFNLKQTFMLPLGSVLVMSAVALLCHRLAVGVLGNALATLLAVGVAVLVYGFMILVTGAITPEEVEKLPKGKKLVRILEKVPFLKRGKI